MPQRAWKALFRDAFQGFRRPYNLEIFRWWLRTTRPRAWAIGAPQASPPPHHQHSENGKEKKKGPRQGGEERSKVTGRHPQGRGTWGNTTRGQGTTARPQTQRKRKARGHGTGGEGTKTGTRTRTMKEGHATPEGPAPPQCCGVPWYAVPWCVVGTWYLLSRLGWRRRWLD